MNKGLSGLLLAGLMGAATQQAAAISINFDFSYDTNNFFSDPTSKSVLQAAGSFFEGIIQDDLTAIASGGGNDFQAKFNDPATGTLVTLPNFSVAADTLTVFAGGRSLGSGTLGIGGPGGFAVSGTTSFVDNAVTRGEQGDTLGASATDFAPWGGAITFNTDTSWYFDTDPSTLESFSGNDFYSVALHELGHLFGIGTADSWDNLIVGSDFTGPAATAVYGGNVPLEDSGHWAEGTQGMVDGLAQEAAMDPTLLVGSRKRFTDLDVAALSDIGWETTVVPVPAAVWLFGSGMIGLLAIARRRA
ncbi:matrixin family metalloprotease [Thiohalobacter sp. IOR34]|uniref:matrixin family metalloprotease n=1 Tax=Thiohalobacter sp. IOR34 TaxID=3057176 RepID=UPI0025B0FBAA|nr:matrixin family metalloprotease [Thiohalobacter sp. IOR34]WJW74268.1 matrixin family metalloprotease [Thiohalobacter sp. IOR34]